MKKTYLGNKSEISNYIKSESYIYYPEENINTIKYANLPEQMDIFGNIDLNKLGALEQGQKNLLEKTILGLKEKLREIYFIQGVNKVLPKIVISRDSDNAILLNWAYSNFRFFITIEIESNNSFYGIVVQDENGDAYSKSGRFNESNYDVIIDKALDFVFNRF